MYPDILHFYLETNTTSVFKEPLDGKYVIYVSSQMIADVKLATHKLGLEDKEGLI